jgi:UDP-N-acetylglucosamine--N-acetylmuramyl-(pentapeptide) pyrophosphoryl-undecaprenol N-acetylglucosamine transferase
MLQNKTIRAISLVVAGGGTGGHLFPGIAVAEEVLAADLNSHVCFIGTGNRFETGVLNAKGFEQQHIRVQSLKGKTMLQQIKTLAFLPWSVLSATWILRKVCPDVVLGVGGYSAGPVVVAAWFLHIPRALHEQNVIPGMTNRLLSYFADRIYVSFADTRINAAAQKIRLTGNPVRKEILSCLGSAPSTARGPVTPDNPFTIFIVGGSQGAHSINTAVMAALKHIRPKDRVAFIHQTGAADEDSVRKAYAEHNTVGTVKPFFNHMEKQYRKADLVICRAGASTIAELTVLGKGVIFVPYPFAADDHQALNARQLVSAGAAELILEKDLTGELLAEKIAYYAASPEKLANMAVKMKRQARPDAARAIVQDLYELAALKGKDKSCKR